MSDVRGFFSMSHERICYVTVTGAVQHQDIRATTEHRWIMMRFNKGIRCKKV